MELSLNVAAPLNYLRLWGIGMGNDVLVKKILPIFMFVVIAFTLGVIVLDKGKGTGASKEKNAAVTTAVPGNSSVYDTEFTGVVKCIDKARMEIILYNIKYGSDMVLNYNGGTDIRNRYDRIISMNQVQIGQICEAGYVRDNMKLTMLHESDKCWEYKNLTNFEFRDSGNAMTINGDRYQFNQDISITLDGVVIDRSKIVQGDEITARGIGNDVYSIVVTKGHGTLEFINFDDLIGGKVMVGNYDAVTIEEGMTLNIREGTYDVWFVNDNLKGQKQVTVSRNTKTKVDLSDIHFEETDTSLVTFKITPDNAILYINGTAHKYNNPVELEYGSYDVDVEAQGYKSYTGKLKVGHSSENLEVELKKDLAENLETDENESDDNTTVQETVKPTEKPTDNGGAGDEEQGQEQTTESENEGNDDNPRRFSDGSGAVG